MNAPRNFNAEQLTAYLDGEAAPALCQAIDSALLDDPDLRRRVDELTIPIGAIKTAFDDMLLSSPSAPRYLDSRQSANQNLANILRPVAATAVICLALGWLMAGYFYRENLNDWHNSVAKYQTLYVNSTLSQVNQSPALADEELSRVMAALGKPVSTGVLNDSPNLTYKRAQILGFEERPLVQLAFISKTGAPVALCIIKSGKSGDSEILPGEYLGMRTASWSKGAYEYFLIGGKDADIINEAAKGFSAKL